MIKHTLAEDQHIHEMTLTVYRSQHEHKLQADNRVTLCQSTKTHQFHTQAALSNAYLEEPGHMPFLDQQSMRRHPSHTSKFSQ